MADTTGTLQEQLHALRTAYVAQLQTKVVAIETAWISIRDERWDLARCIALHRLAHSLAGSGATFGFAGLSEAAHTLAQTLRLVADGGVDMLMEQSGRINALLMALKREAVTATDRSITQDMLLSHDMEPPVSDELNSRLIFLVEDDLELAEDLALQLGHFGYQVRVISRLDQLPGLIAETPPAALVVDMIFPEGDLAGAESIAAIQRGRSTPIPVIFTSIRSDLLARLQAVRAGGHAYFPKPVNAGMLIDMLDRLTERSLPEPYRVLIVDDSDVMAATYAATLEQSGMLATIVTDPLEVLQPLVEFQPDLILMDMYMPGCTGQELAAVVRQQSAFVSIPIVFLSTETDRDRQLTAMGQGGDDFLTKPIMLNHLVSAVMSRAKRARMLRDQMVRDGLTGLLNHTAAEVHLESGLARSRRSETPLAVAMIDVDHFKLINDTYGHAAGDRVLRSLAHLLQQRLRKSDVIGRYGGEEFLVVLPDTDGETARMVLEELRASFSQIRHQGANAEWYVTFSCGIASFPEIKRANALVSAADAALYTAKREGRNRTVLAGSGLRL